jgi:hypothetical protein
MRIKVVDFFLPFLRNKKKQIFLEMMKNVIFAYLILCLPFAVAKNRPNNVLTRSTTKRIDFIFKSLLRLATQIERSFLIENEAHK